MHQHVGRLEIAMDDSLFDDLFHALHQLREDADTFFLIRLLLTQVCFQIAILAELCHDVDAVSSQHHLLELHDVGMVELLQNLDLRFDGFLEILIGVDHLLVYLLYGNTLAAFGVAFVHPTKGTLTKTETFTVGVIPDLFDLITHNICVYNAPIECGMVFPSILCCSSEQFISAINIWTHCWSSSNRQG